MGFIEYIHMQEHALQPRNLAIKEQHAFVSVVQPHDLSQDTLVDVIGIELLADSFEAGEML